MSAAIALDRITKRFGATWAVRDVTFEVAAGELFTLLGPSGCGKTTALRMIAGFTDPDEGEILLDGARVRGTPPWRRGLGFVFQGDALWAHLSVFEHVAFGLRERQVREPEIRARVADALAMVGLEGLERRRPSELSGGQQQRVALARALVLEPRALLLDDPLSSLDARVRAPLRGDLRRLHRELGITVVYATHDQEEAMALSTRVAVLDRGSMVQVGTPADMYRRPQTRFVAELLGGGNLLTGRIEAGPAGPVVRLPNGLGLVTTATEAPGSAVVCVVRPEAIMLRGGPSSGANRFTAKLLSAVYLGGRYDCEVALVGGLTLRAELRGTVEAPEEGREMIVTIAPEDVVVFRE